MFLKNSMPASKSISARSAIAASCAVTTDVACALVNKTTAKTEHFSKNKTSMDRNVILFQQFPIRKLLIRIRL